MPYAAVNGQKLYYEDTGEGASVLVFSHGLLMDHTMFAPQAEALKHRYCSIFFRVLCSGSLRGHEISTITRTYRRQSEGFVALDPESRGCAVSGIRSA
ncbi:alpha/beta hydrolase [Rhodanobacter sp. A1T4]|jgi:pimeloyl-ACP methyl ester carboxylesterase|uniref:alpha/beta fold hydrolase n=1 Tax=Rhodanobacter sp. A1T4 TaxID=2723087 RepID=UPI0017F61148|nr:alpha/beta hydrolase [Rhodanobacter sp. A1T4]MBB6247887.1 pimeloyl-ACP methyl ester carboxylesterase [Rhodanobacter sp. A1T4]